VRRLRPPDHSTRAELSRFDDHLRRISTALYGAGMMAVLLVANTGMVRPEVINSAALNWLVFAAGISVAGIVLFPWHRYNRNLFLVAALDGLCLVALAVYFSGGWESPFFPFYFFVVVFCAIYFSPMVAAPMVLLIVLVSLSPQLYGPEASSLVEHVMVWVPTYVSLAFVSWYMAREVGRRERLQGEYERRLLELGELKDRYQHEASTDHLTGLPNRASFEAQLREELGQAQRQSEELTMIFLDLDDFKRINDAHGHRVGDKSLRLVADALSHNARAADVVARSGGDEFTVLLSSSSPTRIKGYFDRVREEVADRSRRELGLPLRVSAGVASFPRDAGDPDDLLEAADRAMYWAKRLGKDRLFYAPLEAD
jgi:diguanylate cyclase (GGDEF)-like protein